MSTPRRIDVAQPMVAPPSTTPIPTEGPITRARAKLLQAKVNTLLSMCDLNSPLDGVLLSSSTLCILSYEPPDSRQEGSPREEGHAYTPGQFGEGSAPLNQIGAAGITSTYIEPVSRASARSSPNASGATGTTSAHSPAPLSSYRTTSQRTRPVHAEPSSVPPN